MDEPLAQRLRITVDTGMAPLETVAFVEDVLTSLEDTHRVTDDSIGMMASHLIAALVRGSNGEEIAPPPEAAFTEAATASPWAHQRATEIAAAAGNDLGIALPEQEIQYLTIHIATLDVAHRKEEQ